MSFPITINNLRTLVAALPDNLAADESSWRDICAALKNTGGEEAWPIFLEFSSRSAAHNDRQDLESQARRMWLRTIKQSSIGTLLHYLPQGSAFIIESQLEPADPSWKLIPVESTVDALFDMPEPKTSPETLNSFLDVKEASSRDLIDLSPMDFGRFDQPRRQAELTLGQLFNKGDHIFVGEARTAEVFDRGLISLKLGAGLMPYFIVNPLNGVLTDTPDGKSSMRGDNNVTDLRLAVVEFDKLPLYQQYAFWVSAINKGWPVVGVVSSGGKSLHGWLYVGCKDMKEWNKEVKRKLFQQYLEPMGVDGQCKNPARLTRLPGFYRAEYGQFQTLFYLNPDMLKQTKEEMDWI